MCWFGVNPVLWWYKDAITINSQDHSLREVEGVYERMVLKSTKFLDIRDRGLGALWWGLSYGFVGLKISFCGSFRLSTWLPSAHQLTTTLGPWTPSTATLWTLCLSSSTAVKIPSVSSTSPLARFMERPSAASSPTTAPWRRTPSITSWRRMTPLAFLDPSTSRGGLTHAPSS